MNAELLRQIELLVGSIGVILGVFFASFIIATYRKQTKANLFLAIYLLAFSLRIGKSLFHNYFEIDATLRTLFLTVLLCVGPSIWLYTLYIIKPKTKKVVWQYFHFLPFLMILSISGMIPNDGSSWVFGAFYDFLTAHMFFYTMFSLLWVWRQKDIAVVKANPQLKHWLNFFLGVNLVLIIVYFLISQLIIPFYLGLSFLFSVVVILFSFWILKNPFLFKGSVDKYKDSTLDSNEAFGLMEKLRTLMRLEKPYLNPELNLLELSVKLDVSTKELSQAINQVESLNYSQLISRYRVEEVKHLMTTSSYSNMTIAAVAYDCGFNSISTFNAAFKKHAGLTAIAYRKGLEER